MFADEDVNIPTNRNILRRRVRRICAERKRERERDIRLPNSAGNLLREHPKRYTPVQSKYSGKRSLYFRMMERKSISVLTESWFYISGQTSCLNLHTSLLPRHWRPTFPLSFPVMLVIPLLQTTRWWRPTTRPPHESAVKVWVNLSLFWFLYAIPLSLSLSLSLSAFESLISCSLRPLQTTAHARM